MERIIDNTELQKGDIITTIEHGSMWDAETGTYPKQDWMLKFEITRVNKNTYTCKYIEGYLEGSGFKWIKDTDLTKYNEKHEYFY